MFGDFRLGWALFPTRRTNTLTLHARRPEGGGPYVPTGADYAGPIRRSDVQILLGGPPNRASKQLVAPPRYTFPAADILGFGDDLVSADAGGSWFCGPKKRTARNGKPDAPREARNLGLLLS